MQEHMNPTENVRPAESVARHLEGLIQIRKGASLIRLGDGEGVLLSQPQLEHPIIGPYISSHFGSALTQRDVDTLARHLQIAIGRANIIGIRPDALTPEPAPDPAGIAEEEIIGFARRFLTLRPAEHDRLDAASAYRLLLLNRWIGTHGLPQRSLLTNAWCHFDFLESGFLARLMASEGRIGLVTGRAALVGAIEQHGITVDYWPVPLRFLRRDDDWTPHYPDRFEELLETLEPQFPGQIFLVGAGICGKIYCDVIAQRGGIALDIGAVCDAWSGIPSRINVSRSRWGQEQIPGHLLLEAQLGNQTITGRS